MRRSRRSGRLRQRIRSAPSAEPSAGQGTPGWLRFWYAITGAAAMSVTPSADRRSPAQDRFDREIALRHVEGDLARDDRPEQDVLAEEERPRAAG
jgi:hypothetical protein